MFADCPACKTKYDIEYLLPGLATGTIICSVCHKSFDVLKKRNILFQMQAYSTLRNDPDNQKETKVDIDITKHG